MTFLAQELGYFSKNIEIKKMKVQENFNWNLLKETLDIIKSYRFRNLIDSEEEILNSGIYSKEEYYEIIFNLFDKEKIKYSLFEFLKEKKIATIKDLEEFSENINYDYKKILSLAYLLKYENLVDIKRNENSFKLEFSIKNYDFTKIKPIYIPVNEIFDSKICSGCGLCQGICPIDCIKIDNGVGIVDDEKCVRCGLCYTVCPRTYLPIEILNMNIANSNEFQEDSGVGAYLEAYSAKTTIDHISKICQDGGIASTILFYLFTTQQIDGAIGAGMSEDVWKPTPILIKNKDDISKTSGTKYANNPNLQILNQNIECKSLAVVGVPCMMQSLFKSKVYDFFTRNLAKLKYRIGIFCMESFPYESILEIAKIFEVDINEIRKMDINKGKFFIYPNNGEPKSIPIKEITALAREDCKYCHDLTSELADISIGSIGSPVGWSTVLVRTEIGKQIFDGLVEKKFIQYKTLKEVQPGLPILIKNAKRKKDHCNKHLNTKRMENSRIPQYN